MTEEMNKETREIIFKQLQLLEEKSRESKDTIELVEISEQMSKLASIVLSKNFV